MREVEIQMFERELRRDDKIGLIERRSAARSMLAALDHLDELCRETHDNYRYLELLADDERQLDDDSEDAHTIEVLYNIINAGHSRGIWVSRLQYQVMPELKAFWRTHSQDRYHSVDMSDDVKRLGLEGHLIEAVCSKCGESFTPDAESWKGQNTAGEGLYEHYTTYEENECGGLGIITGGYKVGE